MSPVSRKERIPWKNAFFQNIHFSKIMTAFRAENAFCLGRNAINQSDLCWAGWDTHEAPGLLKCYYSFRSKQAAATFLCINSVIFVSVIFGTIGVQRFDLGISILSLPWCARNLAAVMQNKARYQIQFSHDSGLR